MAPLVANAHPIGVHCLQVKLEKVSKFNGRLRNVHEEESEQIRFNP